MKKSVEGDKVVGLLNEIDIRIEQMKEDYEHDKNAIYRFFIPMIFSYVAVIVTLGLKLFPDEFTWCNVLIGLFGVIALTLLGYILTVPFLKKPLDRLRRMHEYIQGLYSIKISVNKARYGMGTLTKSEAEAFEEFINQPSKVDYSELRHLRNFL